MRIGMVSDRQCIRVIKESIGLKTLGHKVLGLATVVNFGSNLLDSFNLYSDELSLQRAIRMLDRSVDIWHCHNEPDWFVRVVKEVTKKPVVWDTHDLESLRAGEPPMQDELDAMNMADGFIHVGEGIRKYTEELHPVILKKPNVTIHLFVNAPYIQEVNMAPSWGSIVYEGGLSTEGEKVWPDGSKGYNFRYWYPVFKAFIAQGYNVTALAAGEDYSNMVYQSIGVALMPYLAFPVMLNAMQPFGFGVVGAATDFPIVQYALPNKLFEYISQGVVPITINARECAKFVTANECGIVLSSADNIKEQLEPGPKLRQRVLELRHELVMENQIHQLVRFYHEVLGG